MHNPSPMSRSIEFKAHTVSEIIDEGWIAWERDRHAPKTSTRPTPIFEEDMRTEVLIGGTKDRLLDLIQLEQIALGLDPGERHLVADKLSTIKRTVSEGEHKLLDELGVTSGALFDLINRASRLKMAVRGWVAESHLEGVLQKLPGVSECRRIEAEGQPDITLRWRGSRPILVECKNVLRKTNAAGHPKVDLQRTRASKGDPCTRYYRSSDFQILAACLHPINERWDFSYALTTELPAHKTCRGRISNNVVVNSLCFTEQAEAIFEKYLSEAG
jgi:hypothetical protein